MPRQPRIHLPGGLFHVILRGNDRRDVFFDHQDRLFFYRLLADGVRRFGYRVHAFCLMPNHVHLALQVGPLTLSKGMQSLSLRYTQYVNRTQRRTGHVFQGRYKALLIDTDAYGLELVRYIHLNPVRAQLVRDPASFPYSGHLGYTGKRAFTFMTTDWVLAQFAERTNAARVRYAEFVAGGVGEGYRPDFHRGNVENRLLGDDRFAERALAMSGQVRQQGERVELQRIVDYVCEQSGLSEEALSAPGKDRRATAARALIGWLALHLSSATLSDVAERFRRDVSTLSRGATQLDRTITEGGSEAAALKLHRLSLTPR